MHAGHGVIENDGFDGFCREDVKALEAVFGGEDVVTSALEKHLANTEANSFIVDTENEMGGSRHAVLGLTR